MVLMWIILWLLGCLEVTRLRGYEVAMRGCWVAQGLRGCSEVTRLRGYEGAKRRMTRFRCFDVWMFRGRMSRGFCFATSQPRNLATPEQPSNPRNPAPPPPHLPATSASFFTRAT